jgi:HD-like signal output (HDOD) protein
MNHAHAVKATPIITLVGQACREVLANRESLPSMPDVAFRIHDAMNSPNWSVSTVAAIIKGDPGTATYLLQVANSSLYRGITRVADIETAVSRLGVKNTRSLVMAHALRSMFRTNSPWLDALMKQTWQSSARLAALSSVLATQVPGFSPERALLDGLLQDIGVLPILNVLKRFVKQLTDEAQIHTAVARYTPQVGMVLLKQWGFEADMVEVARSRGDWHRDRQPAPELADLVLVARLHGNIAWQDGDECPRIDAIPAHAKLPLGDLRADSSLEILYENEVAVDEAMRLLGAKASARSEFAPVVAL